MPSLVPASSLWHTDPLLAGTERNVPGWKRQEQPATWVRASPPSKLASTGTVLLAAVLYVSVWGGEEVLWKKSLLYQSLVSGLPSYSYFLPAFLGLSSLSCLILPSQSSNHVFPCLFLPFHPLMCQFTHLWTSKEDGEEEKGGRHRKRGISGAAEAHINIISLLTWWVFMCGCMHECACVCECVTDRQTGRAGEPPEQHMLYISPIIITSHSLLIMDQAGWTRVHAYRHQYMNVNVH